MSSRFDEVLWLRQFLGDVPKRKPGDYGADELSIDEDHGEKFDPYNHVGRRVLKKEQNRG